MISYIDIVEFALITLVGIGYAVMIVWMQRLERLISAEATFRDDLYQLHRHNAEAIADIKSRFNEMREAGAKLEDDLKGIFESNGIVYASTMKVEPEDWHK